MSSYSRKRKRPSGTRYATQRARKLYRSSRYSRSTALAPPRTGGYFGTSMRSISEAKVKDVDPASYNTDTTGTITLMNGIATGSDFTDRIGRKILMKSIYIRGVFRMEGTNALSTLSRLLLVYDMQTNGVAPAITDILKSANSQSQLNLNNRDRFKILMDKQVAIGGQDIAAGGYGSPTTVALKKFKKCRLETIYGGTLSTVGSINTGALWLISIGDQAAGSAAEFAGSIRVRFIDA